MGSSGLGRCYIVLSEKKVPKKIEDAVTISSQVSLEVHLPVLSLFCGRNFQFTIVIKLWYNLNNRKDISSHDVETYTVH